MRLIANMVIRNEADRYLQSCLEWLRPQVDEIFVGDDRSTDDSVNIALGAGATVYTRGLDETSFLKAEGAFRSLCWQRMIEVFNPGAGDWIVGVDADEFTVGRNLRELAAEAQRNQYVSINVRIPEIFALNPLSERIDGYWGTITGTRLMGFNPSAPQDFRHNRMGSGVFPAYAYEGKNWNERKECGIRMLHMGYANLEDRKSKYERYTSIIANGHADKHIRSIMEPPRLLLWEGEVPEVWRGVR